MVGMYGMAMVIANMPRDLFSKIISPVLLPAFAEKQGNKESMYRAILTLTRSLALLLLPGAALAAWCGKTILTIVYPPKYAQVAMVFGVLCFYIAVVIQTVPLAQVFYGIGKPGQQRLFVVFRTVMMVALIYPAVKLFGLMGAAGTLLVVNTAGLLFQIWLLRGDIGLKVGRYVAAWLPGFAGAVILSIILFMAISIWPGKEYLHLAIGVVACLAMIAGAMLYQIRKGIFLKS